MNDVGTIMIISNKEEVVLNISQILYVQMGGNYAYIHISKELVYQTRITLTELEKALGDNFIMVKRGCLVSAMAIHNVTDKINLCNGESLDYVVRNKKEILAKLRAKQQEMIRSFSEEGIPTTEDQYHEHYSLFDTIPFAFADIEMVFDSECHAIDWVFRYGNPALAQLEKLPLEKLIGNSFGSLFPNMDSKWLRSYERATLYGETLKIIDYSPEINTYLEVICFPTFQGHCGCILFDISQIKSFRKTTDTEKALAIYFGKLVNGNP
ncbi:MAG: LytTR family DNA-binding domain-containing protein [Butyrivibrio sp.]